MIIDTIENLSKYAAVNPRFMKVVEFLASHQLEQLSDGQHPIDGDDVYVKVQTAKGKTPDAAVIESHRKMIDIQIPISGPETYGYTPLCRLPEVTFDEAKDIAKYPDIIAESFIDCTPGMFAIFFPQDGHAPCITMMPEIKKAIFKVKC